MKLKIFKQIAFALVAVVAGMGIGVAIMWGGRGASAAVESHSHPLVYNMGEAATCDHAGHYGYYECEECHKFYEDKEGRNEIAEADLIIPQLKHELVLVEGKNATCGETGVQKHYECKFCHKKFWDKGGKREITNNEEIIAKSAHATIEHVDAKEATCTQEGWYEHYECIFCHEMFHDKAGKNPYPTAFIGYKHNAHWVNEVEATCEHEGVKGHYYCDDCHKCFEDEACQHEIEDVTVEKMPHDLRNCQDEVLPDCEHNGHPAYGECIHCHKYYYLNDNSKEYDPSNLESKYKAQGHDWVSSFTPECRINPYRLKSDEGKAEFNKVNYFDICSKCGEKAGLTSITGYAVLNNDTFTKNNVTVTYSYKNVENFGEVVDYETFTIDQTKLNNNNATIQIIAPDNYTASSICKCQDEVVTLEKVDGYIGQTVLKMEIHFNELHDTLVWEFDWDGDGVAEQIIHVVAA